jgi:hypothetical protein
VAVDIGDTDLAKRPQLSLNVQQLVRWVFRIRLDSERRQELFVQESERAARTKTIKRFLIQGALPRVTEMVNRETRYHRVKRSKRLRQWAFQVVPDDRDRRVTGETGL